MTRGIRSAAVPETYTDLPPEPGRPWTPLTVFVFLTFEDHDGWWRWECGYHGKAQANAHRLRDRWGFEATAADTAVFVRRAGVES